MTSDDRSREVGDLLTELAGRVASARAERGVSLRALSALTGLSSATLSEFERGEHDLTVRKAAPLVRWLLAVPPAPEGEAVRRVPIPDDLRNVRERAIHVVAHEQARTRGDRHGAVTIADALDAAGLLADDEPAPGHAQAEGAGETAGSEQ